MAKSRRFSADTVESQGSVLTHVITGTETGVQYLLAISPGLGSGLSVLVDRDDKPLRAR